MYVYCVELPMSKETQHWCDTTFEVTLSNKEIKQINQNS